MSKTTDILCIGGVRGGIVVNANVPPETYIEFPFAGGVTSYTRREWADAVGNKYHIATPTGFDVPADDSIALAIENARHAPAWDLRVPFPTPQANKV